MKKALSLILALGLCLGLCACGDVEQNNHEPMTAATDMLGVDADLNTDWLVRGTNINVATLRECVEIVELTTENWREHFQVYSYSYTEEKVNKDAFGEIVSTEAIQHEGRVLGVGNDRYHCLDEVVVEIKDKTTGEVFVIRYDTYSEEDAVTITEDFDLDNYECTRIQGYIYYLNIPMGELPVDTYLWPIFPADVSPNPGALYISPGTHAFDTFNGYVIEWFS